MKHFVNALVVMLALVLTPARSAIISGESLQISGHVKDDAGKPLAELSVDGDDFVGDIFPAKTDAEGYYVINIKAEGNYQVTVNCAQLTALGYECAKPVPLTLTSGAVELDFTVHPAVPPLQITNVFLADGQAGMMYKTQLSAEGGHPPYKWQIAPGSTKLPAGLKLNTTGLLSGTPVTNSMVPITFQVVDSTLITTNKVLSLAINPGSPEK